MNTEINSGELRKIEEEESINIREVIGKYLYHWPVFLIGVVFCLALAFLYLRYTKPVYEISSTLLIKDEKKGMPTEDILSQLDLMGGSKVVENEVEILKSKTLMTTVAKRLNLNVNLTAEGRVISTEIYEERPVNFQTFEMNEEYFGREWKLTFLNQNQYVLTDPLTGKKLTGPLNQLQRNDIGTYKVDKRPAFTKQHKNVYSLTFEDPIKVVNDCLARLEVFVATKQSTVLKLTYQSTVPERGKDILNTLIQVYNEAALTDKNRTTQSTIDFIDERLALITGELVEVEKDVEGFKSSQGLTDISSEAQLYLENVKANDAKLNEVNLQLGVIQDIQRYVDSESPQEKLPSTMGIDDPVLLGQITQLSELQLKKINLLATAQPDNPIFESINQQIDATRAGIKTNIKNIAAALESTRTSLSSYNTQYESSIKRIPGQERQFISIKRQQSIKESLYLYLLQKKEEAALSYASAVADSRVVDTAFASTKPIKPKKVLTYLIALFAGLILPIGYIYSKELINDKVKSKADILRITNAPILGELMYEEGIEAIVVQANSRRAIAEQFRALRTNLQFVQGKQREGRGFVTLFTSSMSGEGKSFVGTNVATALAISGKRTVLLELDLRKPKVSKYLDLNNKTGLSNYLIGKANIADIIQSSGINPNLMVIGSGPVPPNPSELLVGREIEELLNYLKSNFDEIIIDTPPIGLVTDAQILSRLTDATIYIVRHGVTFKHQISQLDALYRSNKFPRLNVVLNGVQLGGNYGYGYDYGYGYGYYSDDVKHHKATLKAIFKEIFKRF